MADFYLLPPRPLIGEEVAKLIRPYLPGMRISAAEGVRILEAVVNASRNKAFLIHREDLPEGEEPVQALCDGFGADAGDRITHVSLGARPGEPRVRVLSAQDIPVMVG
jgi:hypothetical protein